MGYLSFSDAKDERKKLVNGWTYIEKALPGSKDVLQQICAMLTLAHSPTSVRQNKKSEKKKNLVVYKYHIVFENGKKFATIYIDINNKDNYKVRLFYKDKKPHEAKVVGFSTLDELQEHIADFL
ncbi:gp110 [Bacillus phage G]|uniref:Gp110 n=1 Tax=Bacillus phage G TaxID=2884420 RepID=G3MBH2_9CAUD|nr:gp110 [Bacillus phage G]AEO93372.1 gp110 [Bacillus phage G]